MLVSYLVDGTIAAHGLGTHHIFGIALLNVTTYNFARLTTRLYKIPLPHEKLAIFSVVTWLIAVVAHFALGASFEVSALFICVGVAAPGMFAGIGILRRAGSLTIIDRFFALLIVAEALHMLDYPFLRNIEAVAVYGFSLGLVQVYFASMLIPVVINRRISADFSEMLEREVEAKTKHLEESLTRLHETQIRLVHASKLASLGEMAGGIAHEINTPLGTIALRASQVRRLIKTGRFDDESVEKFLVVIEDTVARIDRIISGLRLYSTPGTDNAHVVMPLAKIVEETLALCEEHFKHHEVGLILPVIPDAVEINCEPVQLSQVLLNLLSNARDAVKSLTGTRRVEITFQGFGDRVVLSVIDSGEGVPPEIRGRILDPFFTTKQVGEGTGLGLSIAKGIVEAHGGRLYLDERSTVTRFVVELPKTQKIPLDSLGLEAGMSTA